MADSILPVPLNLGLDLVTPPLMIEPGALISCLNYEMTDTAGIRRIDGYEQYDGYPNGDVNSYYTLTLNGYVGTIPIGTVIYRGTTTGGPVPVGTIVGVNANGTYDVVVHRTPLDFVAEPSFLTLSDATALLLLSDNSSGLVINGNAVGFTANFTVIVGLVTSPITIGSLPIIGTNTATSPQAYIDNIRNYSVVLRASVGAAPGPIAGLYWFKDRLLAAINALRLVSTSKATAGSLVLWNGKYYKVLESVLSGSTYLTYLRPTGKTSATVNSNIQGVSSTFVNTILWGTANPGSAVQASDVDSAYAYLGYFNNPSISSVRGFSYLSEASQFNYTGGSFAGTLPPPTTLDSTTFYYIVNGTNVLKIKLTAVIVKTGAFNTNNATGTAQVEVVEVISGNRDYVVSGDALHKNYPVTAGSLVFTVNSAPVLPLLAGTGSLDAKGTRYVWDSFNFYGQSSSTTAYGTTGATRAFWANKTGYGTVTVIDDPVKDTPKYLAFHANKLALGFEKGSVFLSAAGEAYNFQGFDGALELATGDDVTGLLEAPGDTLIVFGRRSIRKITGSTDVDTRLQTVSGKAGAFDYTAILVGANPVFAGLNGISTLEQTAAYGDFVGEKVSDKIGSWLRPKLASSFIGFEQGGAACAFTVRSKNQYRLVLRTGEVVVVIFTSDGPKITLSNWTTAGQLPRIPYAWSSEISDDNKERLHVRWEGTSLEKQVYQLDSGWGFNGVTFNHHFDTAHVFNQQGSMFMGIEKIRLYGQGHGVASLNIKSSGIEDDFDQEYHDAVQDISMPRNIELLTGQMKPVTSIIDQANWGLGIKLRIQGNSGENAATTEPSHICQALILHTRTEGATDG